MEHAQDRAASRTDESRPRRRDRHGRGMRGPVAPPQVPLAVTRSDAFVDLVLDSAQRLQRRLSQLSEVEFGVLDVPLKDNGQAEGGAWDGDEASVPLGQVIKAVPGKHPDRIVVYRRPVEIRAKNRDERALLVHEIVVEQVAELLGLTPESVDPQYGQD
ncbi:metallopeptidase family protein [Streptomyces boninensis]|uniref:metallopeptidase family protein n=1 Tax=Streptomyces boninensis TaxID=2039455 RepID=UPI003B2268C4